MIQIRPFDKEKDYPAFVAIANATWLYSPLTEESLRQWDDSRPDQPCWGRFMADIGGEAVGVGSYSQLADDPQRFEVYIGVLPAHERRGIGTRLYYALLEAIAPHHPAQLLADAREAGASRVQFWQKQGFVETLRMWESRLDVAGFDLNALQSQADKVRASGIAIFSYAELAYDTQRDQKLYQLDSEVSRDIPSAHPLVALSFDEYKKQHLLSPDFLPDGWFIAVDAQSGKFVGISTLNKSGEPLSILTTYLTGVLREYRGRGIASALKLHAVLYAKEKNVSEIHTRNANTNKEMLTINQKMGFIKKPGWVDFKKELK